MLLAGSADGLFRLTGLDGGSDATVDLVHDTGAVLRIRTFDAFDGVFAATRTGLYHAVDGESWTDLGVPHESVYAVGAAPDGRLFAGTRPAHIYVASPAAASEAAGSLDPPAWRELEGFQDLPSREAWRLPRHDDLAQVRDVHVHPAAPDRVVAGVEVGGVHVSADGGETWTERRDGIHDDVHDLHLVDADTFVVATGYGLYRSVDAGRTWTRLDAAHEQRYFRTATTFGGDIYASAALAHPATWADPDADPALFVSRDGAALERLEYPVPDGTITGLAPVDDGLAAVTHHGTVLVGGPDDWRVATSLPVEGDSAGSTTPLQEVGDAR